MILLDTRKEGRRMLSWKGGVFCRVAIFTSSFFLINIILDRSFLTQSYIPENWDAVVAVHFVHGSWSFSGCVTNNRLGGIFGGHVALEVDSVVYSFGVADKQSVHYFPRRKQELFNAKLNWQPHSEWEEETIKEKVTTIYIPVSPLKKQKIKEVFCDFDEQLPYDYALFGMRCASNIYEVLSGAGILKMPRWRYQLVSRAFYPRQFRQKLVAWAKFNHFMIERKEGIDCRYWEG